MSRATLKKLLQSQKKSAFRSKNWSELRIEEVKRLGGGWEINIPSLEIGFVFDKNGHLEGIYNWKG